MNKTNHYRITKFNPAFRDTKGRFLKSDWTSISDDVGMEDYLRIENRYAKSVIDCIALCGIKKVMVRSIEDKRTAFKLSRRKTEIGANDWGAIDALVRLALREKLWFKLTGSKSFYVHFGWDYYMYVGGKFRIKASKMNNLFVENFRSPFFEE